MRDTQEAGLACVRYCVEAGIAIVTLNRPHELNAFDYAMGAEMRAAMLAAEEDESVRVVVLTGAGRAFCAGARLAPSRSSSPQDGKTQREAQLAQPGRWPFEIRKPVIAAINGHAIGVGITWPLICDMRIVAEEAKLGFVFVRRGIIPELASTAVLPKLVGMTRAAELLMSGRIFSGAHAAEIGLANAALPADRVLPEALRLAREIADETAPAATAITKALFWKHTGLDIAAIIENEAPYFDWCVAQPDAAEGVKAFLEKRKPTWHGRLADGLPF